ncbi:13322_t:CDS:2, partial [Cetraspora pellucida]
MPNWPAPSPEIQHLLRILPSQCSGHPLGPLWQAFNPIKVDKKTKAICIFCKHENPISGTAAQNNIQKSLEFLQSSSDMSIDSTSITPISSQDLTVTMSNNNQFLLDSYKSNQLLLEGMIEGGAPLSLVDAQKFKEFIYSINSQYHLPARRQLSSHILDNVYDNIQLSIQQFIYKSDWITIATDGWTNIRQDHLVNYIAIGKNRKSELIKVKDTHGESQTSATILHDLIEVITELGIEKITLPCVAHELNLLVGDMLKHTYMKSTITLALKIITYFRKSTQAIQFICDRACDNTFWFSLPTLTRWNSYFISLKQIQDKSRFLKEMIYKKFLSNNNQTNTNTTNDSDTAYNLETDFITEDEFYTFQNLEQQLENPEETLLTTIKNFDGFNTYDQVSYNQIIEEDNTWSFNQIEYSMALEDLFLLEKLDN